MKTFQNAIATSTLFTLKEVTRTVKGKAHTSVSAVATAEGKTAVKKAVADLLTGKGDGLVPVLSDLGLSVTAEQAYKAFLTSVKATRQEDDTLAIMLRGEGVATVARLIPAIYALLVTNGTVRTFGKEKAPTMRERLEVSEKKASNLEKLLKLHPELAAELANL